LLSFGQEIALRNGLTQSHTCATAILIDENDAGLFEGPSYYFQSRPSRLTSAALQLMDRNSANAGAFGEFMLAPAQKASCRSALR
jgi:hypothetical protein